MISEPNEDPVQAREVEVVAPLDEAAVKSDLVKDPNSDSETANPEDRHAGSQKSEKYAHTVNANETVGGGVFYRGTVLSRFTADWLAAIFGDFEAPTAVLFCKQSIELM